MSKKPKRWTWEEFFMQDVKFDIGFEGERNYKNASKFFQASYPKKCFEANEPYINHLEKENKSLKARIKELEKENSGNLNRWRVVVKYSEMLEEAIKSWKKEEEINLENESKYIRSLGEKDRKILDLESKCERYRTALEFYADPDTKVCDDSFCAHTLNGHIRFVKGRRAREALKEINDNE